MLLLIYSAIPGQPQPNNGSNARLHKISDPELGGRSPYFFALYATNGRFKINGIQYPLIRKRKVKKACTAASGTI